MTYLLHTYGCQMNVRDSEMLAALFESCGLLPARDEADADLILINTCAVREKAEDKAIGKARLLCAKKKTRPLLVGFTGCMAQRLGHELFKRVPRLDFALGTRSFNVIPELLQRLRDGDTRIAYLDPPTNSPGNPDQHLAAPLSAFVTVLLGCNRRCAYCIVPDVRGPEYSRPAADILNEVQTLVQNGTREITLLGQSVMRYGLANDAWHSSTSATYREPFPRLLHAVAQTPNLRRLRFTSAHPTGCTDELIDVLRRHPNICHHLHLPVQSGSDTILAAMRRGYTRDDYLNTLRRLRAAIPDIAITTDIIVGFPGETEDDFQQTLSLVREAAFDNSFIFKYSPRPGTPAASLDDSLSPEEKMRRNQLLLDLQDQVGQTLNDNLLHTTLDILVEGPSLRNPSRWSGRTSTNKIVIFENPGSISPGDLLPVIITRVLPQTLYASLASQ